MVNIVGKIKSGLDFRLAGYPYNPILEIENDYKKKVIPRSTSVFSDDIWIVEDGSDLPKKFDFCDYMLSDGNCLGSDEFVVLRLFLKVRTYHLFHVDSAKGQPLSTQTIYSLFVAARNYLIKFMIRNGIFFHERDSNSSKDLTSLTPSLFESLIWEIQGLQYKNLTKFNIFSAISRYLSQDLNVPSFFRPPFNYYSALAPSQLFSFNDSDIDGYEPIPYDDYLWIGKSALDFVHCYSAEIIQLHRLMVQAFETDPPSQVKDAYELAISRGLSDHQAKAAYIKPWRLFKLIQLMSENGAVLPCFSAEHRALWNIEEVSLPPTDISLNALKNSEFTTTYLYYLFQLLFGALCTLILIPTGMRRNELRRIDIKHLSQVPNRDGIYSYINGIKKVKSSGTFISPNEIPIPIETWNAFKILDQLSAPLRNGDSRICVKPLNMASATAGSIISDKYGTIIGFKEWGTFEPLMDSAIAAFCRFVRSATIPTTHQFRKTIAEFMLLKTRKAPLLICQLFGHRSITMTLKYLKRNSLIRREIKEYAMERFRPAATIVARAVITGSCAGPMAERIIKAVGEREEFHGLNEAEMMLSLEEWLMDRVQKQSLVLIHTPISVCCRSAQATDTPPCSGLGLDVEPSNCMGAKCGWALFTNEQSDKINSELVFYKNLLKSFDHKFTENQLFYSQASDFVETYDSIANRIKSIPIDECQNFF